jgi:hypothetical protein
VIDHTGRKGSHWGNCVGAARPTQPLDKIVVVFRAEFGLQVPGARLAIWIAVMPDRREDGDKHHYIPKFYLKQWAGADGCVCEFSRPYQAKPGHVAPAKPPVKARRVNPDGTGYLRGLNTFARLRPELADYLEHRFLKIIDSKASEILGMLNRDNVDFADRSCWARFVMSQLHRSPEGIRRVGEMVASSFKHDLAAMIELDYDELRTEKDPPTFEEFRYSYTQADVDQVQLLILSRIMNSELVGTALVRMCWGVIRTDTLIHRLLSCDRPLVMTDGLARPDAHILLPISPVRIFAVAHTEEVLRQINDKMQQGGGVQLLNNRLVRQARKYVWAVDDKPLQFIEERLGDKIKWCPWE